MLSKNCKKEVISLREIIRREIKEDLRFLEFQQIEERLKKHLKEKVCTECL